MGRGLKSRRPEQDRSRQLGAGGWYGNGSLVTDDSYVYFELTLEFFVDESGNSNVYIGGSDAEGIRDTSSCEMNNFDIRSNPDHRPEELSTLSKR